MTSFVQTRVSNHTGFITLDRPKALNSLSLDMIRAITQTLLNWKESTEVRAVVIYGSEERAFCAGGDIRFFHDLGRASPLDGSAFIEDFFTEEYTLNHLIHHYPKPYIALLNGVVMGGGMGIGQAGPTNQMRIVTERTKMAMPEVNIGLFPDVGGSYFLSRCEGEIGTYLALSGEVINAADAIYAKLADVFIPSPHLPSLISLLENTEEADVRKFIRQFAKQFQGQLPEGQLAQQHDIIDEYFALATVPAICHALSKDTSAFAQKTLKAMQTRSPLMMCVTLKQLRLGKKLSLADCLRMERTMVRHSFTYGEVLEGVRALVVDKDMQPKWRPANLSEVTQELIDKFFTPVWPAYAHPLRDLI